MKAFIVASALLVFLFPLNAHSQWSQDTTFKPVDGDLFGNVHGVAVDPDGKVWIQPYYPTETITVSRNIGGDNTTTTSVVYVYNADGTPADFSPLIYIVYEDGTPTDTLGTGWTGEKYEYNSGRGVETSISDGNIIISQFNTLYKVDYKTGKGLAKAVVEQCEGAITESSTDETGSVYVGCVAATNTPLVRFDADLENPEVLLTIGEGFSRDFQVSPDGNTIWYAGYTLGTVLRYTRDDEFSPYSATPDSILKGMKSESFDIHPITGDLWLSAGSVNDFPELPWAPQTWYAFDTEELASGVETPVDSIKWVPGLVGEPFDGARPRGLDFSPDGDIAYVAGFSASDTEIDVQKFIKGESPVSVQDASGQSLPAGITLAQNYPNPFNPSTVIGFELARSGWVTLRVFDMTGREVARLVEGVKPVGIHEVVFEAAQLPSGTYLYTLQMEGFTVTRHMTLLK